MAARLMFLIPVRWVTIMLVLVPCFLYDRDALSCPEDGRSNLFDSGSLWVGKVGWIVLEQGGVFYFKKGA